ncbi:CBM9 family sugar-binding protein [Winogradskyella sp. DF17]|uniref:CBM9 family sugar-binding protein n=1 Tax=Winogradskyella pelagia TaxID=2819984 RepID=A0ABS3T048_9FLAO|nr:DUF6265 family protein [Winogradskyella sp. DF17]MBO3116118.1 CBM9 family sugar-binding protein [Winogradskyella sp. DF17]
MNFKTTYFIVILSISSFFCQAQKETKLEPKLENISWISGTWHGEAFGGQTEEIWSEPSDGSMMATFKLTVDGKVQFYEIEIIREVNNSLVLQLKHFNNDLKGWETKDETIDFPLKYITASKAVFEGMSFEKVSNNQMNIFVDIKNDMGDIETVEFKYYRKIKPYNKPTVVRKSTSEISIDGLANEPIWQTVAWQAIDQLWLGDTFTKDDFSGRYKLTWTEDALYLLAEIRDDVLLDQNKDPLKAWWDDDCLEIFLDENNNGGNHQYNHSAFAYHVDLDGNVVDMATDKTGKLYNSHIDSKRITKGNITTWELKILVYDESYSDQSAGTPVQLAPNKKMGFALAYCDNDNSEHRENFIGSSNNEGFKQDLGWKNASVFGTLILKEKD